MTLSRQKFYSSIDGPADFGEEDANNLKNARRSKIWIWYIQEIITETGLPDRYMRKDIPDRHIENIPGEDICQWKLKFKNRQYS